MKSPPCAADFDLMICEIDGCLSPESSDAMDMPNLVRIADFNRRAVELRDRPLLNCCTGRPLPFVEATCRLPRNVAVLGVAENGV